MNTLTTRQRRLLQRIVDGDCPRASHREYNELCEFDVRLAGNLQMESAGAADTRDGYIITHLHTPPRTYAACREVLAENPPPPRGAVATNKNQSLPAEVRAALARSKKARLHAARPHVVAGIRTLLSIYADELFRDDRHATSTELRNIAAVRAWLKDVTT